MSFPSHCRSYEFKVSYKSVARMFYLDRPSGVTGDRSSRYALVISLDDPIRHGAQRHPHLVMQLERGAEVSEEAGRARRLVRKTGVG